MLHINSSDLNKRVVPYEKESLYFLSKLSVVLAKIKMLRNFTIRIICKLEGGQLRSSTYRSLMKRYYDIEIGRYSYGECLFPGRLTRGTKIGNFCSVASGVSVFRRSHPVKFLSLHPFFFNSHLGILDSDTIDAIEDNPLSIGDDVWIGANAIITPRCKKIGIGAVVAAGAVVTADVPDFTIVAGNPARVIKKRFAEEICSEIYESRWWMYRLSQLVPMLQIFIKDATIENARNLRHHLSRQIPMQ